MMSLRMNRLHRHTRPSKFVSRTCREGQFIAARPGVSGFSFTGEFPGQDDFQPVEKAAARRSYTAPNAQHRYHEPVARHYGPAVCKKGAKPAAALLMLAALAVALGSIWLSGVSDTRRASNSISDRQNAINQLTTSCQDLRSDIAYTSGDVNVRLIAGQLGMVSARGQQVTYLETPTDAVITLADTSSILSLANVWGQ